MRHYFKISYYNKAFNSMYSIEKDDLDEAIEQAKRVSALPEMQHVKLEEIKELSFTSI